MTVVLREFLRDPLRMASVAPSSPELTRTMLAPVPRSGAPVVVELGPGTGAFTEALQARRPARHVAIELDPGLAARLRERFPQVEVVADSAAALPGILAERGLRHADVVVSGLPWAAYAGGGLPRTIADALAPHGAFTQFTYTWSRWAPPSRRQLAELRGAFDEVVVGRTVWRNIPPALVYSARRPLLTTAG
jgi:phospholipid N-methyltransferase